MSEPCRDTASESIEAGVREKYRRVAERASGHFPYPVGRRSAERLGYPPEWLEGIPGEIVDRFVGVGNPFSVHPPRSGERVLDVGCGCGLDARVAARLVGPTGRVVGVDLTPEMLEVARRGLATTSPENLAFREASASCLPFDAGSFDLAISNGALSLVADKDAAFREIARVLRPGATFVAADVLATAAVPREILEDPAAWAT